MNENEDIMKVANAISKILHDKSVDDILKYCMENHCKGFLNNPISCPLSKVIANEVGFPVIFGYVHNFSYFSVFPIGPNDLDIPVSKLTKIEAPLTCGEFARRFDNGEYPDLIAYSGDK